MKELYAHSANSQGQRHRLDDHLKGTAERAADMAKEFGCSRWGWLAGLWHDVGVCRKSLVYFHHKRDNENMKVVEKDKVISGMLATN